MSQNRLIGIALLVIGVIALFFGINATDSPAEEMAEAFTGRYSDQTMMYLLGGAVAAVAGLYMLMRK